MAPSATVVACLLVLAQAEVLDSPFLTCRHLSDISLFISLLEYRTGDADGFQEWLGWTGEKKPVLVRFWKRNLAGKTFLAGETSCVDVVPRVVVAPRAEVYNKKNEEDIQNLEMSCKMLKEVHDKFNSVLNKDYATHFPWFKHKSGLEELASIARPPNPFAARPPNPFEPVFAVFQIQPASTQLPGWLEAKTPRSSDDMEKVVQQLFEALALLHYLGWQHGHLRPENVFLDQTDRLWLYPVGPKKFLEGDRTAFLGKDLFEAGEVLNWMVEKNEEKRKSVEWLHVPRGHLRKFWETVDIKALAKELLQHEPSERPTAGKVLQEYFKKELPPRLERPQGSQAQ